jgi:hypothetical protein
MQKKHSFFGVPNFSLFSSAQNLTYIIFLNAIFLEKKYFTMKESMKSRLAVDVPMLFIASSHISAVAKK